MSPFRNRLLGPAVLLAACLGLGPTPARAAGKNYAFLVACEKYSKAELRSLRYTKNDILAFHKLLLQNEFTAERTVLMHDGQQDTDLLPEARKLRKQMRLLLRQLGETDTLVVAFSGHGVQFKGQKQAYFCPADSELEDRTTLISLAEIYEALKACSAGRKLLLVDACRNSPQSALSKDLAKVDLEKLTGLQKAPVPKGVVALFSCSEGEQSFEDPELGHGIFFHHVLKGWQGAAANGAGKVTLTGLAEYVIDATPQYARLNFKKSQVPQLKGELSGLWILRAEDPAQGVFREGKALLAQHDYAGALAKFNEAIRVNPRFAPAYQQRGELGISTSAFERVIADCTEAIRLDPALLVTRITRGAAYRHTHQYDLAAADYRHVIHSVDPKDAGQYELRGEAYFGLAQAGRGDYAPCLADLSQALRLNPKAGSAYLTRGWAYFEMRDYDRAVADFSAALGIDPKDSSACHARGCAYRDKGDNTKAIADFTKAVRLRPGYAWAYCNRAWAYNNRAWKTKSKKDYKRAVSDFQRAIRISPEFAYPYHGLGWSYNDQGAHGKAIAACTRAIQLNPRFAAAYATRGAAYADRREYDLAIADGSEAIRIDPKYARAYNGRGYAYEGKRDYGRAIADYTAAIRLDPNFAKAYGNRSRVYQALGQTALARKDRKVFDRLTRGKK
jgi:tetratricopeptide (TPR) repeat protein